MPYVDIMFVKNWFWAIMPATMPGASATSMAVPSSIMSQSPKFCSKAEAPVNMSVMSVTPETSQVLRGWLNAEAL